jgi:hypothetical protein
VLYRECRADLRSTGAPCEDRGGCLLPAHRSHFRELGLTRTCHQGRPGPERRTVRDRPPRLGSRRRSRSPARRSRGASRRESEGPDRLAAHVLGHAVGSGPGSEPARAGGEPVLVRRAQQRRRCCDERPGSRSPAAHGTPGTLRAARDAQPRGPSPRASAPHRRHTS